jgi:diguanylate cyclase (GGDEF)-like protein/PAS domain S-box-containing protein
MTLNRFQQDLRGVDPAFLIDPQGIVLVASRPHLDYQSLWPVTVTDSARLKAQYGTDRFTPIFPQAISKDARVEFAGKRYLVTRQSIGEVISPGWTLVNLTPFHSVVYYRLLGIAAAFVLVILTLVFAGSNLSIREGANRILASEARFRAIFDAAPEAVFVFDPETRRILEANPFMAQWLGYDPEELVNLEIEQILEPGRAGAPAAAGAGPGAMAGVTSRRYRRKDGRLVDVELTSAQIFYEDHIREIVFVRDVTERQQAENEVRQAKEYLENILDNSADSIGIVDSHGRIIKWNKASARLFGYSLHELEGKSSFDLYADKEEMQKMLSQLRRDGSVHGYQIYLKKKDGSIVPFALSISFLYDRSRKVIGSVCVARDRSEIKKTLDDLAAVNQQLQQEVAERQRAEAELAWDGRVNASMVELSRALMSSLPLDEIASLVYKHALELTDSRLAFCGYLNPQTGALVVSTLTGEVWEGCQITDKKTEFYEFGGLWGWVLKHAQPLLTNDLPADPRSKGIPPGHLPIHRFLAVPAIIGDELVGLIALANADRDYTTRDQEVCERLARLYALAIHRHRLDETLRESESGLKTILDTVQTGVLIIDPETHVIVDANLEALKMIGVAKERIVGSVCHKFVCPAEPGRCPVTDLHESVHNAERQVLRPDGTSFWIIQTVLPVTLYGKTHLLESFVDISERKLSEEALSKNYQELQETAQRLELSRNTLQMVIESVPVRVFWKDRELRYLGCNTLFARDAGFSHPEQLLGKDDFSMGWREQADLYRTDDRQVMESRRPKLNIIEPQTTPTGAKIWLNTSKVPLQMPNGEVFGVLGVYEDITARRQAEEAVQTANARLQALVAQVEERNRTMTLANEMADMLQSCLVSEEAYEAISHFMPRFFPDDAGALYMLNNSRNLFEAVVSWGQAAEWSSGFAPDECWSVRRGRLHRVDNSQEALLCRHVTESIAGGYLCVPLIAQGETLGVFHIRLGTQEEERVAELEAAKEQLALMVAEDMALALANLRLRETLRSQAIRDPLTGLFNRRYLEETLDRELTRVKRQGTPLGMIMMDLDHFKQYNDTFGHSAGDELLSALGSLVKSQIREEDIACRYGGEEFLLILPGTSMEVTLERAEILRQAVQEMHLRYRSLKPITLSLGVAVYPDHGDTGLEIIQAADAALYRAKQAGRDRVMAAGDAAELGKAQAPVPSVSLLEAG